jgi:hypothetical protein
LSGTPDVFTYDAVNTSARFVGIGIGSENINDMTTKEATNAGMSQTEIFLHKREQHSYDWMSRQHEQAQVFNDIAVRKTDPDYHKWRVHEHRIAVTLPPHEIALHLELKVYLATFEDGSEWRQVLTQKRAIETSEDGHRVRRLRNIITSADSKEEALLKSLCGVYNGLSARVTSSLSGGGGGPLSGIRAVVRQRRKELTEAKQEFAVYFADAIALHNSIVYGGTCPRLSKTSDKKKLLHKSMPKACTDFGDRTKRPQ